MQSGHAGMAPGATNIVKTKFLTGQSTYGKLFENVMVPESNVDGNYICANAKYMSVSILFLNFTILLYL